MIRRINFRINRKSLQWQIMSRFFLILTALFLAFGVYQYISMSNYLYSNKSGALELRFHNINLQAIGHISSNADIKKNSAIIIKNLSEVNSSVSIIDNNGNVIDVSIPIAEKNKKDPDNDNDIDTNKPKLARNIAVPKLSSEDYLNILKQQGNLERNFRIVKDENNVMQMVAWRKIGDLTSPTGLIQLSCPIDDIQSILQRQIILYLGGLILILLVGTVLGEAVFNRTLKPLYNMTNTVENITVGELNTRLPEDNGLLEIDKLSGSFNKMLTGIEESFNNEQKIKEKMRQFVSDASHELRTPLTSIHGFVEVLLRGAAKNEEQLNAALKSILTESERLTKLVQDLLTITRLDRKPSVELKTENINEVIKEIYPQLHILAGERQLKLNLGDALTAKINRDQIKQVIFNLTQNAVHYTDSKNGIITIAANLEKKDSREVIALRISDNGTGISEEHINKIFDRFFRSEYHRSREHGGYGLGLSIVKSIVDAHGGEITVNSTLGSGTTFTVYLNVS